MSDSEDPFVSFTHAHECYLEYSGRTCNQILINAPSAIIPCLDVDRVRVLIVITMIVRIQYVDRCQAPRSAFMDDGSREVYVVVLHLSYLNQ